MYVLTDLWTQYDNMFSCCILPQAIYEPVIEYVWVDSPRNKCKALGKTSLWLKLATMNVLGLDEVLNLVRQYGDDGEAAPEERRRGRGQGGRRPLGRGLREHHRRNQAQRAQRQAQRQESRICPCWFGGLGRWPSGLRIVRKAIMVMAGQLVRKLILPWQQYPWRLWPLALPDARAQPRLGETRAQTTWKRGTPPGLNMGEAEAAQNNRFQPVSVRFSEDLGSARSCWTWQRELCAWRGPSLATTTGWTESSL